MPIAFSNGRRLSWLVCVIGLGSPGAAWAQATASVHVGAQVLLVGPTAEGLQATNMMVASAEASRRLIQTRLATVVRREPGSVAPGARRPAAPADNPIARDRQVEVHFLRN